MDATGLKDDLPPITTFLNRLLALPIALQGILFAAFAIGRLLTAVGITPGGVGIVESVAGAALVGWGAEPGPAAAGVILFSIFTHLMEVPLGALGWLAWSMSPRASKAEVEAVDAASPA